MTGSKNNVFDSITTRAFRKKNSKKSKETAKKGDFIKDHLDDEIRILNGMNKDNTKIINKIKRLKWREYTWPRIRKTAIATITMASIAYGTYSFYCNNIKQDLHREETTNTYQPVLDNRISFLEKKYTALQEEKKIMQKDLMHKYASEIEKNESISGLLDKKDETIEYLRTSNKRLEDRLEEQKKNRMIVPKTTQDNMPKKESKKYFYYFPVRGDTLYKIAWIITGDGNNWHRIKQYNRLPSDLIEVNQALRIPPDIITDQSRLYAGNLECYVYKAKSSDTLDIISKRLYGDSRYSDDIYNYNKRFNPFFSQRIWNREWILVPKGSVKK